ncbi:hypothetical protein N7462_009700 [Penicillium macrosclerotiorum]|uniref:uncharacterized protein n=1 Tax=Penicillium macrosclerotiorum TaxID=303699 RepID=UPI0025488D14|nr:uncharacterized protein N7462_009700 [Penicillium macrosclerotiorum]KAJ5674261.1 hypothetical protein N7462_009700 [Penicillium macrosclerotiorum]
MSSRTPTDPSQNNVGGHSPTGSSSARANVEATAYYQSFLNRLLDLIARGEQASVDRVIARIRAGDSEHQILALIDQVHGNRY